MPQPETADPRIAAIQAYLSDQRAAGRWVFGLVNPEIAELLAVADQAAKSTGRAPRRCVYCHQTGPRVVVAGGYAHRRCIPGGNQQ